MYIDGNHVDTVYMTYDYGGFSNVYYNFYKFHYIAPGEHTLTLKYNGYKHGALLPDNEPCTYTTKIFVPEYKIDLNQDYVEITYGDSVTFSGTFTKNGQPFANKEVTVNYGLFCLGTVTTDENGHFEYTLTNERIVIIDH